MIIIIIIIVIIIIIYQNNFHCTLVFPSFFHYW